MARVPSGIEKLPKISIVLVWRTNVTDRRQTDRRTDDDIKLKFMFTKFTFAKNAHCAPLQRAIIPRPV